MDFKAQGAIEYLLIIAAAIVVVAVVLVAIISLLNTGTQQVTSTNAGGAADPLKKLSATENTITAFTIPNQVGTSNIGSSTISVTMPFGTPRNNLTPSITVPEFATVSPTGAQDFTNPVSYTITSGNGSTKTYAVTVTNALNPAKDITGFSITGQIGSSTINTTAGTVGFTMPFGAYVNSLSPTIAISPTATGINPASGSTQNFSGTPVSYIVTAADATTKTYAATATVSPAAQSINASATAYDGKTSALIRGIVGLWHLDETSGATSFADVSNHSRPFTCVAGTCPTLSGTAHGGMIFSGTGGSAKKASLASVLSLGANGTISIWATFVAAGAGPVPSKSVFIYDGARAVLSLDRASNNKIYFNPGGTEVATGTLSPAIIANGTTWYNIVVSRAGTIADIYVNNVKYSITGLGTNALTLQTIGAGFASGATANEFNGTIDEVVVWDRQLSTTEVNTLYTSRGTGW